MFTRQHSILQDELGGVKVDPALARARKSRMFIYIAAAFITLAFIYFVLFDRSLLFVPFFYLYLVVSSLFQIISFTKRVKYQERLEQRRQAATRGDHNLLASEQPQPDATALPLPITLCPRLSRLSQHSRVRYMQIRRRLRIRFLVMGLLALIVLILMYVVLSYLLTLLPGSRLSPQTFTLFFLGSVAFVILLLFGLSLGIRYARGREQLTITEHGLMKIGPWGKIHSVSWQQARLFAIDGMYGLKKMDRIIPTRYELSSAHNIVHWGPLLNTAVVSGEAGSSLQAQANYVQALHSLIAARTGLPLYDLREG